jgi:hypothetical protein
MEFCSVGYENEISNYNGFFCGAAAYREPGPFLYLRFLYHSDAPQLVGLFWTSDQLVAEISTCDSTQHSQQISYS